MNKLHLLWIIPLVGLVSGIIMFNVGVEVAFESLNQFETFACEMCADGLQFCSEMTTYMINFNGTTKDAINNYTTIHRDRFEEMFNKYGMEENIFLIEQKVIN